MACSSNTLFMSRPTRTDSNRVNCACGDFNPTGRCNPGIGPRRNRELVRQDIKDFVLGMLGAPMVRIELNEQNLDLAVDQSLKIFEDYAPREYFEYYVFDTVPGKSVYQMPPEVGLIRNVHYRESGSYGFQASDLDGALPLEYFAPGSTMQHSFLDPVQPVWGRMGEWVLYKQYENMFSRVSSSLGGWEWVGGFRHIKLYPTPCGGRCNRVIVHYLQNCKDWMNVTEAMQMGALAFAKIMLGRVRSKYGNPLGPGGGLQLDGATLLQEGAEDLKQWRQDLLDRYGDVLGITMG